MIIDSYNTTKENELKIQANMDYCHASTLAGFIGSMFSKDSKPPTMEDVYGWLFNKDNTIDEDIEIIDGKKYREIDGIKYRVFTKEEAELEMQKERFKDFASQHNEKFNK